jgi:hypothetical protein
MVADIILWLQSINTIMTAASKIYESANQIYNKMRFFGPKDETKKLISDIGELQDKIDHIGKVGVILADYITYYIGTYVIYMLSDKLVEQISVYSDKLKTKDTVYWQIVENPFKDVEEQKSKYINIILNRKELLDIKDSSQIILMATEISNKCTSANAFMRTKSTDEFINCIRDINNQSLNLYRIFENSISNMTNGLIKLKR